MPPFDSQFGSGTNCPAAYVPEYNPSETVSALAILNVFPNPLKASSAIPSIYLAGKELLFKNCNPATKSNPKTLFPNKIPMLLSVCE